MWCWILKFAGGSLFKYAMPALIGIVITFAGFKAKSHYDDLVNTKAKYEDAQLLIGELQSANQSLLGQLSDQEQRHNEEVSRLNDDREALDKERFAIQKRAFIEAGKLKKELEESKDAKNWYDSVLPDAIKRLRNN